MSQENFLIFTGRRKSAIAQVKLLEGNGEFFINGIKAVNYTQQDEFSLVIMEAPFKVIALQQETSTTATKDTPSKIVSLQQKYNIFVKVVGGGLVGQAEAIQLGIARALSSFELSYRKALKEKGYLKRDSRCKERKKYGLKKARKAPQFSKR